MQIKIKNYDKKTSINVNLLSDKVKDAFNYCMDYLYTRKEQDDKIKIEVRK